MSAPGGHGSRARHGPSSERGTPPRRRRASEPAPAHPTDLQLDATLRALSDPTRRGVIDQLRGGPKRAGELSSALDMTKPAMTRHLRVLRETGLVAEDPLPQDARVRIYRLRREPFSTLRGWLDQVEAFWGMQLDGFKEHAERTRGRRRRRAS